MNRAEIDHLMYQQDRRWANIVQSALYKHHPAAKRAAQFLKNEWSRTFTRWLDESSVAGAITDAHVNKLLGFMHNSLYPAALAAGFPDTSFVFPDIEVDGANEATYPVPSFNTTVGGPHGGHGGHGGGGGWRRRPGRRHFDVGPSYAYPPPWYSWPDDPLIVECDDETGGAFVSGSGDPWEAVLGATSEPVRHGVLATVAPVLAPATSPITFKLHLDEHQRLTARVCVDGRCYEGTINLGPVIREVLDKTAAFHKQLHEREAHAAQVVAEHHGHQAMPDVAVAGAGDDAALAATEEALELAGELLVDKVVDHHIDTVAAGWWGDIKKKVSGAARGVQHTIAKHKGAIAAIAAAAAGTGAAMIPGVGPLAAPLAASAAHNMVNAASGDGDMKAAAKQALAVAQAAAKKDKRVAKALATAEKAVAQTTAAYHVADTIASASEGDPKAAEDVLAMTDAAKGGDPAAKVAMDMAAQILGPERQVEQQASGELTASLGHWLVPLALGIPAGAVGSYFAHDKVKQWLEGHQFAKPTAVASGAWSDVSKAMFAARGAGSTREAPALAPRAPARRVEGTGKPILIQVLTEDGALTDRLVMWHPTHDQIKLFGGKIPAYYTDDEDGLFLFADRHGDKIDQGPLAGKRFKSYHPTWEVRTWERTLSQELADALTETASAGTPNAVTVGAEAALATLQEQARGIASRSTGGVVGVVRSATGQWYAPTFQSGDDADDWLGRVLGHPTWFTYAAYFDKGDPMWPRPLNEGIGRQAATVARRGTPIQRSVATVGAEAGLAGIRRMASSGAAAMPGDVIGIVRRATGTWGMYRFNSSDDADDWFGATTSNPSRFVYAAYFDKGDTMWPSPLNEAVGHAAHAHPHVAGLFDDVTHAIRRGANSVASFVHHPPGWFAVAMPLFTTENQRYLAGKLGGSTGTKLYDAGVRAVAERCLGPQGPALVETYNKVAEDAAHGNLNAKQIIAKAPQIATLAAASKHGPAAFRKAVAHTNSATHEAA